MILELSGLRAAYGATRVLHGIDFGMEEKSITALLGANGAGKTTTLRAICGMVRTEGAVRFGGQEIQNRRTEDVARLGIAHVPDGRGTFLHLTTEENLRLGAHARKDRANVARDLAKMYEYFPRLKERSSAQPIPVGDSRLIPPIYLLTRFLRTTVSVPTNTSWM